MAQPVAPRPFPALRRSAAPRVGETRPEAVALLRGPQGTAVRSRAVVIYLPAKYDLPQS